MKASELLLKARKLSNPVFVDPRATWCSPDHVNPSLLDHIIMRIGTSVLTMALDTATWRAFPFGLLAVFTGLYPHPPQKVNIRSFN